MWPSDDDEEAWPRAASAITAALAIALALSTLCFDKGLPLLEFSKPDIIGSQKDLMKIIFQTF